MMCVYHYLYFQCKHRSTGTLEKSALHRNSCKLIYDFDVSVKYRIEGKQFFLRWIMNIVFSLTLLADDYGRYTFYLSLGYLLASIVLFGFENFYIRESRKSNHNIIVRRFFY